MAEEKNFENKVKRFLSAEGCYFVKQFGCAFTKSGVPDLLICVNGKFVAVELKATKGKPSMLQLINLEQIKKSGGISMILYPNDFDKFKNLIWEMKK